MPFKFAPTTFPGTRPTMRRLSAFLLHATAAGIMAWGYLNALTHTKELRTQKGGHFQFLTHHGLVSALSYMALSLFCDVFPSVVPVVGHLKKTFLMISMPLAFTISSIYWPLPLLDPHSTTHPAAVMRLPLMIDLALHALPLFTLLIDFYVFESKFSNTYVHKAAPVAAVVLPVWYASFVEYCATFNGYFPYPFLTASPFAIRILIYTVVAATTFGCFRMLNALHA